MKYLSATLLLFMLSLVAALLSLYYGNLTRNIDKDIYSIKSQINFYNEKIRVNELEYTIHTKTDYLMDLQNIYLDNKKNSSNIKFISLNSLNEDNVINFFTVSLQ